MKARISNIITESVIKLWKPGDNVLVSAPMGSGKSYFCKNTLYNVAKNNNADGFAEAVYKFALE